MTDDAPIGRSIDRAFKSTIKLADIVVEESVKAVPFGEPAYKLVKVLGKHAQNFLLDRTEKRLEDLHTLLLNGIESEFQETFLNTEFSIEDYSSILLHVTQDEEDAKVPIYAKLLHGLILRKIPIWEKTHIIKAARNLTVWEFEKMRTMYIRNMYEFMGSQGKNQQLEAASSPNNSLESSSFEKLISLGFLKREENFFSPTDLLKTIIEISIDPERLTPVSEGYQEKTLAAARCVLLVATNDIEDVHLQQLDKRLYSENIAHITVRLTRPLPKEIEFGLLGVAICVGAQGSLFEKVKEFVSLDGLEIFQIRLPGAALDMMPLKDKPVVDLSGSGNLRACIDAFITDLRLLIEKRECNRPYNRAWR